MVRNITEQTTRKALNEQQLNEAGLWRGIAKAGRGIGKWLGKGHKAAEKAIPTLQNDLGMYKTFLRNSPKNKYFAQNVEKYSKELADAQKLVKNAARTRGLLGGTALGGLGVYTLAGDGGGTPAPSSAQGGGYDPYNGGYTDPYAGYYNGGYADPYGGYYSGGYADPYAGYYGGGSSGGMDPAMMQYFLNQSGNNAGSMDPMMMYLLSGY